MPLCARLAVAVLLLASVSAWAQSSASETRVWALEEAYWQYVQANDLERYRALWHPDFLGWPNSSPEPARKAGITGWITAHSAKGESLKSFQLEKRILQVIGDLVTVTYRVHLTWLNKDGSSHSEKVRIIHTWRHGSGEEWQIISGMSAPTNAEGR
jgi:ketosteroid isomerase-like protein